MQKWKIHTRFQSISVVVLDVKTGNRFHQRIWQFTASGAISDTFVNVVRHIAEWSRSTKSFFLWVDTFYTHFSDI